VLVQLVQLVTVQVVLVAGLDTLAVLVAVAEAEVVPQYVMVV
jgi:hypothetical protein